MKKFGDIRDRMPPSCPMTGYDCGKIECGADHATCIAAPKPNSGNKVWGTTTPLILSPMFELHHLDIKPWHVCSIHTHRFKHNAFYILSGTMFIDVWPNDNGRAVHCRVGALSDRVVKAPGLNHPAHFTVGPGVRHRFRTGADPCVALEMYYTEPLSEDIQRENEGGPV